MSLDDTLHTTFETLRRSVDEALTREVKSVEAQLRSAIDQERRTILEQADLTAQAAADLRAVTTASSASAVEIDRARQASYDEGFDAGRAVGWENGRHHGTAEGRQAALGDASARELANSERLVASVRQIDAMRTVPEMLDVLLKCAMQEAARAAVLIVRGQELQGWKFIGFGARTENPTEFRQAVLGSGVIEEAIRTGQAATTHGVVRVPAPAFAELKLGRRAIGVPIVIQGRAVAVLYADQGSRELPPEHPSEGVAWPAAIEVMVRHASRCLEASSALRPAQPGQPGPAGHAAPASTPGLSPAAPAPSAGTAAHAHTPVPVGGLR